jgi:hypothetical protein
MKRIVLTLTAAVITATSGCYLAAIPRYKEIERPVTASEMSGRWVLTPESQRSMVIDGFVKKGGEELAIILNAEGTCSYRTVLDRRYVEMEGQWSTEHMPSDHFKNRLDFRFKDHVVSRMRVAMDSSEMVLCESWGDPDAGVDLVYRKEKIVEPDGSANGSQPIRSETNRTSSAAGSRR